MKSMSPGDPLNYTYDGPNAYDLMPGREYTLIGRVQAHQYLGNPYYVSNFLVLRLKIPERGDASRQGFTARLRAAAKQGVGADKIEAFVGLAGEREPARIDAEAFQFHRDSEIQREDLAPENPVVYWRISDTDVVGLVWLKDGTIKLFRAVSSK
jgi:hypothetical protein